MADTYVQDNGEKGETNHGGPAVVNHVYAACSRIDLNSMSVRTGNLGRPGIARSWLGPVGSSWQEFTYT